MKRIIYWSLIVVLVGSLAVAGVAMASSLDQAVKGIRAFANGPFSRAEVKDLLSHVSGVLKRDQQSPDPSPGDPDNTDKDPGDNPGEDPQEDPSDEPVKTEMTLGEYREWSLNLYNEFDRAIWTHQYLHKDLREGKTITFAAAKKLALDAQAPLEEVWELYLSLDSKRVPQRKRNDHETLGKAVRAMIDKGIPWLLQATNDKDMKKVEQYIYEIAAIKSTMSRAIMQ